MAREDTIAKGIDARRALEDPALKHAFETVERDLVDALATITLTGTVECNALVLEKTRDLQANRRLRQRLWELVSLGSLEENRKTRNK